MMMHDNHKKHYSRLGPLLFAVALSWRRALAQSLAGEGVSDATALPLVVLHSLADGMRQNELADALGVEGTSVVRVLDSLERDGFVRRLEDQDDRRAKRIFLTAEGRDVAMRAEDILATLRAELLHDVAMEDIEATERLLNAMSQTLAVRLSKRKS